MQQFFAILKDSYREAVDGFVIYLMLGLAGLMVVLIGSVSYEPEGPGEALPEVLEQFNVVFPDRGRNALPVGVPPLLEYKASEAAQAADGTITFVLSAEYTDRAFRGPKVEDGKGPKAEKPRAPGGIDVFRFAVAAWKLPAGEKIKEDPRLARNRMLNQGGGDKKLELVMPPNMKDEDLKSVTDEDMAAFVQSQFVLFVGLGTPAVTVTRRAGVPEPEYQFDVALKSVTGARGWPHKIHVLFKAFPPITGVQLGLALYFIQDIVVNGVGAAITLVLCVIITAFFIPNMLRKGSLDLLVSKPIGRAQLLIYKYVGGLTFIFLVSTFTIGAVWLVMAARSGYWDPSFLLVIPALTFTFAVVYSVSALVAVLTRSAIASILVSIAFMFGMWVIGKGKEFLDRRKVTNRESLPEWLYTVVDVLNNILPRYKDLDKLTTKLSVDANLPEGLSRLLGLLVEFPSFGGAVGVSLIFIVLMLGLASWRLVKRDG